MSAGLSEVWHEVEKYILDDLSIIPVRDKDDDRGYAKSPLGKWTYNQKHRYNKDELWHVMEKFNTSAVGIVCGKVSENLEVIDIDSKYLPGIDATLFKDLENFYPEIWPLLRIHKTPSGGFHLLYRITGGVPEGNQKLAGRLPSEYEVQQDKINNPHKKKELKEINFLETRGEGGQVVAPPSLNYLVYRDVPIPVLTWEQRCSIINLCKTYNTIIKVEQTYKPTKHDDSVYDLNPFEDFNKRCDPVELCENNGWKREKENNRFIWFTRPGKSKGISLSWNKEKNIFYSFSSSTDLDASRGYNAASFLAIYQFNNDRKETYKWLIEHGYGQIKPAVEKQLIQRAKISGTSVPLNLSKAGLTELETEIEAEKEAHPFGVFWEVDKNGKYSISRILLYNISNSLGLRLYNDEPVQIIGQFINLLDEGKYFDLLIKYIKEPEKIEYVKICNALEAFLQNSGIYTISRLRPLDLDYVLKDTANTAYKCYLNYILEIKFEEVKILSYSDIDTMLVWQHKVLNRNIQPFSEAPKAYSYIDFLQKAIGLSEYLCQVIGYLIHDFKDENTGYIITLTEKSPDPKGGGGSGKNIFGNLLRHITTVCTVAGSQIQFNENFLQAWHEERILFMADVPKKFDFEYIKEMSTGYGTYKKLFKDLRTIPPDEMPKMLVNTNFSFDASDGGLKRRIIPIEFTNFFTACGGVDAHYGFMFPGGWTDQDWLGYDWFMAMALQYYFKTKGKIVAAELSSGGWEKQFKQKFGELTYNFIAESIAEWCAIEKVPNDLFKNQYETFCAENNINRQFQLSSTLMNRAIASYCEKYEIKFESDVQKKENSKNVKYRIFNKGNELFSEVTEK